MLAKALLSSAKGDWTTPRDLFDQLDLEFLFNIDVAATRENRRLAAYFGPGSTWGEDALVPGLRWEPRPFDVGRAWCNPPYGRGVGVWVDKAIDEAMHGNLTVMLLPARTDTRWFHLASQHAEIRLIKGRLTFGGAPAAAPFPSALFIFRPHIEGPYQWITI